MSSTAARVPRCSGAWTTSTSNCATLPQQTTDLTELRTRRAQLTAEITKLEKALEEVQAA